MMTTDNKPTEITAAEFVRGGYAKLIAEGKCVVHFVDGERPIKSIEHQPSVQGEYYLEWACGSGGYIWSGGTFTVEWLPEAAQASDRDPAAVWAGLTEGERDALKNLNEDMNEDTWERLIRLGLINSSTTSMDIWRTPFGADVLAVSEPAPAAEVAGSAAKQERDYELTSKILSLLGVDPSDWGNSLSGIYAAIRCNLEIGEQQMSKIDDWTDSELNEDSITNNLFQLLQRAQKTETDLTTVRSQLAASEQEAGKLRAALERCGRECPQCTGTGYVITGWDDDLYENIEGICPNCSGSGKMQGD